MIIDDIEKIQNGKNKIYYNLSILLKIKKFKIKIEIRMLINLLILKVFKYDCR